MSKSRLHTQRHKPCLCVQYMSHEWAQDLSGRHHKSAVLNTSWSKLFFLPYSKPQNFDEIVFLLFHWIISVKQEILLCWCLVFINNNKKDLLILTFNLSYKLARSGYSYLSATLLVGFMQYMFWICWEGRRWMHVVWSRRPYSAP